jgi:hypothetical protein
MPRRAEARPTLTRKIHFFRADVGVDDAGQPIPFDVVPAMRVIDRLPFTNVNRRYLLDDEGNALCVWPNMNGANATLRFCQIRRTGLPQLEQAGNVTDLNIAADAGLLEPIYVVFFPGNIVGVEYNHYGLSPAYTNVGRQADRSLGDAFAANAQVLNDPEEIEIAIKPGRNSRRGALSGSAMPSRT